MLWRPPPFTREGEAAASPSLFCCSRGCRNEQPSGPADPLATHQGWLRISHTALPPGSRRNDLQSTLRPSASDASLNFILGTGLPPIFSGFRVRTRYEYPSRDRPQQAQRTRLSGLSASSSVTSSNFGLQVTHSVICRPAITRQSSLPVCRHTVCNNNGHHRRRSSGTARP